MGGFGPRLWTIWTGLKNSHPRARVACSDWARAMGLGLALGAGWGLDYYFFFYKKFIYVFLINIFLIAVLSPNSCVCSVWFLNSCDFLILISNNWVRSD